MKQFFAKLNFEDFLSREIGPFKSAKATIKAVEKMKKETNNAILNFSLIVKDSSKL